MILEGEAQAVGGFVSAESEVLAEVDPAFALRELTSGNGGLSAMLAHEGMVLELP